MQRARRHQRLLAWLAFGLASLAVELVGRSLTHRLDLGRHVAAPSYSGADYYPVLLAGVKLGIALLVARLAWRIARARALERAGRRLLDATGARPRRAPRVRLQLSPRLALASFALSSLPYLLQEDLAGADAGRWPLLAPWLHSSALPVFAVLAVIVAVAWSALGGWLAEYEDYAAATFARARRLFAAAPPPAHPPAPVQALPPRLLFGLAFESRPPPLPSA